MPKSKAKRGKKQLSAKQKGIYRFHGLADYTDGTETKFYDVTNSIIGSDLDEPHVITPLVGMEQNSSAQGRDGLKIWVKSISVKVAYSKTNSKLDGSFSKPETRWYWRLFVDRNTNGTAVVVSDYQGTPTSRSNQGGLQVFQPNLANAQRFTTLKTGSSLSKSYKQDGDQDDQTGHHEIFIRIPGRGMEVTINNVDGSITGFKSNNLYLILQNDDTIDYFHTYHVHSRVRFTD